MASERVSKKELDNLLQNLLKGTFKGPYLVRGIEREALRVLGRARGAKGLHKIAQTPHPVLMGPALTHPFLTTDFSEAHLEMVMPTFNTIAEIISFAKELNAYTYKILDRSGESLWHFSMPCPIYDANSIHYAYYGHSLLGQLKYYYRKGLGARYGKVLQSLSGIHYNLSLSDPFLSELAHSYFGQKSGLSAGELSLFKNEIYFKGMKYFNLYAWAFYYLFGSTNIFHKSFLNKKKLKESVLKDEKILAFGRDKKGLLASNALSLRMGPLGYQNAGVHPLSLKSFENYLADMKQILSTKHPVFGELPCVDEEGEIRQLSKAEVQNENEIYSPIRPKVKHDFPKDRALNALREKGIDYLEVRLLDINPFKDLGLDEEEMGFLEVFFMYAMLSDDFEIDSKRQKIIESNNNQVSLRGRRSNFKVSKWTFEGGHLVEVGKEPIAKVLHSFLTELVPLGEFLDALYQTKLYSKSVQLQKAKLQKSENMPSEILQHRIMSDLKINYVDLIGSNALETRDRFLSFKNSKDFEKSLELTYLDAQRKFSSAKEVSKTEVIAFLEKYNLVKC